MMEKAIKQRLLGGLVLVAGAALFLPVLLDGSGAVLTIPPLPAAPEVGGVEAMAPRLDHKVAETEQAVDAAHAGRDAAPAEAEAGAGAAAGAAPAGDATDVAPDAAAAAGEGSSPVAPTPSASVAAGSAAKPAPSPAKPAPAPVAAVAPAPAARPVVPVPAKPPVPPAPTVADKPSTGAPATARPSAGGAWVVQVASLSSREKAQALVQQLRRKGYPAVLNPQGGQFKVVVGPELNRAVADSIKSRLAADPELKLNGWVQAYKP